MTSLLCGNGSLKTTLSTTSPFGTMQPMLKAGEFTGFLLRKMAGKLLVAMPYLLWQPLIEQEVFVSVKLIFKQERLLVPTKHGHVLFLKL